ncbi:Peptidase inhibitor family I36 [Lentzea xinjiangensis]|uniref:Peptidase inhibitor family I36 n=1 Tax=Lentzea xinjiangensis TaxID=402600 RepID=A0A1H9VQB8_9PSEU|nr:peptidase inhibitor family I36 protein [Lentzea xinjiangensis]SES23748.1 Peptidase inhibitor family I36 [Lentzea xinjiangensis]
MNVFRIGVAVVFSLATVMAVSAPATALPARSQVCPSGYVCLYEHNDFNRDADGRMLKWNLAGEKKLEDWGFRDKTSSIRDNRSGGVRATNVLAGRPDQHKDYNGNYSSLGDWNDKIDRITLP